MRPKFTEFEFPFHASAAGDGIKIGVIEKVEELNAKLEFSGLGHLSVLVDREIKIV